MRTVAMLFLASLVQVLAACGGGGPAQVPAGATCSCGQHCECTESSCKCAGGMGNCPHCKGKMSMPAPAPAVDGGAP